MSLSSRSGAMVKLVGALSIGILVAGTAGVVLDLVPWTPVPGPGLGIDFDIEMLGVVVGLSAVGLDHVHRAPRSAGEVHPTPRRAVYVTRALLDLLRSAAADAEPEQLSVTLSVTPAGRLDGATELPASAPVFTHLYLPKSPNAVSSVFGVDLQTPPGRTQGRFTSHPTSAPTLSERDDFKEVVVVAVPPWEDDDVVAYDRHGRRLPLEVVDAEPPQEPLPGLEQGDF